MAISALCLTYGGGALCSLFPRDDIISDAVNTSEKFPNCLLSTSVNYIAFLTVFAISQNVALFAINADGNRLADRWLMFRPCRQREVRFSASGSAVVFVNIPAIMFPVKSYARSALSSAHQANNEPPVYQSTVRWITRRPAQHRATHSSSLPVRVAYSTWLVENEKSHRKSSGLSVNIQRVVEHCILKENSTGHKANLYLSVCLRRSPIH